MIDRPYQTEAEDAVVTEYDKNVRRMLLVMATGTGKTIVLSRLYEKLKSRLKGRMIVLAHTEELVDQNREKIQTINPTLKVGKEMAGNYADLDCDIISASVATLGRDGTKRLDRLEWEKIDKLIVDEAHHSTASAYRRVIDRFSQPTPDVVDGNRLLVGVTATPDRSDGVSLSSNYDRVVYTYSLRQAITDGWLVGIRGFRVSTNTVLDAVAKSYGDFVVGELSNAVNTPYRNKLVVEAWQAKGEDRQTVAFTVDIKHAQDLAEEFRKSGVSAEAVWGDDPDRAEKLRLHREGKIRVLCNCGVLVEGYDDWNIGVVLLCRPTQSPVLFTQMVGRGTRLAPEGMTKAPLIVIDVVDGTMKNSLITLPTLVGLQNNLDLNGMGIVEAVTMLEGLQETHPNVDFSKLIDISGTKALIESVDLFQIRFPEEVEQNSELVWYRAAAGGFRINIKKETTKNGFVHVYENILGKWELDGEINDEKFHGTRPSVEEIFRIADEQIRKRVTAYTLSLVKRKATWHDKPVTKQQITLLGKLFPKKLFPIDQMTSGDASRVIGERLARFKK